MRLYRVKTGIIIEAKEKFYFLEDEDWDTFFDDDDLFNKLQKITLEQDPIKNGRAILETEIMAPIQNQEIWASGVTYFNSKLGRQEESKNSGGGQFYAHVYEAERPELFFKATASRTVGPGEEVRIRKDSEWNVPEPELTLAISSSGKIIGFTIGNDMSSRSIEGENPLYLPQAKTYDGCASLGPCIKTYDGCASLGPCIYVTETSLEKDTLIQMSIYRDGKQVFHGETNLKQMKRSPEELVSFLYRECSFPNGSFLMTGTGIVPSSEFTLNQGDEIHITIQPIGTLKNTVK
jgi:2-dehydro-3-deoxy-D-arabinonate dehydratase